LISEIKVIQAAPPTSITGESALKLCQVLIITITHPKITTPIDTMTSVDHLSRADRIAKAPAIAPNPKHPSNIPYPIAVLFTLRASVGSNAKSTLEKNTTTPVRNNTVRIAGKWRT
jgi:hypothetical protein